MAMFHRDDEGSSKDIETVIGASVKVEGSFVGAGDIIVEGHVAGTLKTNKNLRVGPRAVLKADVEGGNIVVAGEIRGQVKCAGKIELLPTAKIYGDIDTQTISVEHGAVLHGKVTMAGQPMVEPAPSGKEKNARS